MSDPFYDDRLLTKGIKFQLAMDNFPPEWRALTKDYDVLAIEYAIKGLTPTVAAERLAERFGPPNSKVGPCRSPRLAAFFPPHLRPKVRKP